MKKPKRDLYAELGVKKSASKDQIKKAFRKRARQTHPDHNGKAEEFHAVQTAYLVLSDDAKRQRYDATGDDEEPRMQNSAHITLFIQTVMQVLSRETDRPVLDCAKRDLGAQIAQLESQISEGKKSVSKLKECAQRFSKKDGGDNLLSSALERQSQSTEAALEQYRQQLDVVKKAHSMCDEYVYKCPKSRQGYYQNAEYVTMEQIFGPGVRFFKTGTY